jgi:hypothetical protein
MRELFGEMLHFLNVDVSTNYGQQNQSDDNEARFVQGWGLLAADCRG